jgi:hypothetical protein
MHPKRVSRLQDAFDCILQQQLAESLPADGYGSRKATDPHSWYWIYGQSYAVRFSQPLEGHGGSAEAVISQNPGRPLGVNQHEGGCNPFDAMLSG